MLILDRFLQKPQMFVVGIIAPPVSQGEIIARFQGEIVGFIFRADKHRRTADGAVGLKLKHRAGINVAENGELLLQTSGQLRQQKVDILIVFNVFFQKQTPPLFKCSPANLIHRLAERFLEALAVVLHILKVFLHLLDTLPQNGFLFAQQAAGRRNGAGVQIGFDLTGAESQF